MQWTGQKVMFDLRSQIFRHLQRMSVAFFDKNPVGRLVTRVTSDVDALNEMFTTGVVAIFEDIFVLAGIIFIMLRMNWWLALIAFSVLPIIFWATMVFRGVVRDSYRRIRLAVARINSFLQEHVSGMVVLQLFNREKRAYEDFKKVNELNMEGWKDAILAHAIYYPVVEVLSTLAIAAVFWFGGIRVMFGAVTLGVLSAFMQYAQRFFRPIMDLSEKYNILQSAMASSERVFKLLDTPADIVSPGQPADAPVRGRIEFDHVWFAYRKLEAHDKDDKNEAPIPAASTNGTQPPASDSDSSLYDWILRDVSFRIEPGETVAIVGHTGAGKTTIISLLVRFYDVQRGSIRFGGEDTRDFAPLDLRRQFGVVLQDPYLFTGTIEENIRLGTDGIHSADVENAAEQV